jgi:endonuclease/exonuclease/phosphatase family metal-dependent hydrolase
LTRLTVGEWNVHWGVARVPRVARGAPFDVVGALPEALRGADVLVLPESWRAHDGSSFVDGLDELGFVHRAEVRFATLRISGPVREVTDPGEGWWHLALASRHPIVEHALLPIARTFGDQVPRRHAIAVTIDVGGTLVDVVAFHVSSKLWWAAPWVHLHSLRRQLAARGIDGVRRPALLIGDANLWRAWMPTVLPGWRALEFGATFPSWRPHSQIDQVLLRGAVDVLDARVLPYSPTSDHRAVVARLALT